MAWRTADYVCDVCGAETSDHLAPAPLPAALPCPCGAEQRKVIGAPVVLKASYPEGSHRLDHMREQRKLKREERKAVWRGDKDTMRRVAQEKKALGRHVTRDKGPE